VAEALRKEPDVDVQLVDGGRGEFTVQVDGQEASRKKGETLPPVEEIVNAVRKAGATPTRV
jgi:hypothetical protein